MPETDIKLSRYSRRGGAASKLAPGILQQALAGVAPGILPPQLLAGGAQVDDAVVYQLNPQQAMVVSTDFFTPIVDDPFDFGRIAATNALSAIYAMGGTPLFALAVAGMPGQELPAPTIGRIFEGGAGVCRAAGIPLAGGHSIEAGEPIYGLVAIGLVNPEHLKRNSGARAGDKLILGKPIGVGVYAEMLRQGRLTGSEYEALLESACQLNTPGPVLACLDGVHALTDIGGGGLQAHLLDVCRGGGLRAAIDFSSLPLLPKLREFVEDRQFAASLEPGRTELDALLTLAPHLGEAERLLLGDPQTSGGLLVACAADTVTEVLSIFLQQGFSHVSVIGELGDGACGIDVR